MNKLPSTGAMLFIGKMLLVHCLNAHGANAWEDTCETFANIYEDGKDLCNTIFGDAFEYTTNEDKAYTMWYVSMWPYVLPPFVSSCILMAWAY